MVYGHSSLLTNSSRRCTLGDPLRSFDPRCLMNILVMLPNNLTLTTTTALTTGDGAGHAVV